LAHHNWPTGQLHFRALRRKIIAVVRFFMKGGEMQEREGQGTGDAGALGTPSKGEATQQRILAAAYALFLEQGYHGTSMRQIAARAGLTMGGVYNHFDGKESIWEAVFMAKHPYRTILPRLAGIEGETAAQFVRRAAGAVVGELEQHGDLLNLMFIELVEFNGKHLPSVLHAALPHMQTLADKSEPLRKELRPVEGPVLIRAFFGLFFSYYVTERLMPPEVRSTMGEPALDAFVDIFLHGILAGAPARPE
jgi:AcrR family transcriptional regulator